jgi:hypothetical protein
MEKMQKIIVLAIFFMALISSCIGQEEAEDIEGTIEEIEEAGEKEEAGEPEIVEEEGWTAEQWKEHLFFLDMREQSAMGMISGLRNLDALPMGTHMKYNVAFGGELEQTGAPIDIIIGLTISGKESVDGIECTVIDFTQEMQMESFGITMNMIAEGIEWVDETGAPVKMEATAEADSEEMEMLTTFTGNRIGEESYKGHECWIYEMTQTSEVMDQSTEMKLVQYVDKSSYAVVRTIYEMMGTEQDSGYLEPAVSTGEFDWELGNRETITTPMGTFDCQIIYLKENNKVLGTIWANEEYNAPIKYFYSYKTEDTEFEMTLTLLEYA